MADDERMRNPFQNEEDTFRVLLVILAAAAVVIVVALLISPLVGALIGVAALGAGLWKTGVWLANALSEPDEDRDGP
jgi:hypothetical protein